MTIKRVETARREIDLGGPEGNAFALIGIATKWLRQLGYDDDDVNEILDNMKSGDYANLVGIMEEEFGSFCDIILPAGVDSIEDL